MENTSPRPHAKMSYNLYYVKSDIYQPLNRSRFNQNIRLFLYSNNFIRKPPLCNGGFSDYILVLQALLQKLILFPKRVQNIFLRRITMRFFRQ